MEIGSVAELIVGLIRIGLVFLLSKLGYTETQAEKLITQIGYVAVSLLIASLFYITSKYN